VGGRIVVWDFLDGDLAGLSKAMKIPGTQFIANPKSRDLNHLVEHRLTSRDQTACLSLGKNSEKTGDFQAALHGDPSASLFVDEQKSSR
jgi:hypothetical protein